MDIDDRGERKGPECLRVHRKANSPHKSSSLAPNKSALGRNDIATHELLRDATVRYSYRKRASLPFTRISLPSSSKQIATREREGVTERKKAVLPVELLLASPRRPVLSVFLLQRFLLLGLPLPTCTLLLSVPLQILPPLILTSQTKLRSGRQATYTNLRFWLADPIPHFACSCLQRVHFSPQFRRFILALR